MMLSIILVVDAVPQRVLDLNQAVLGIKQVATGLIQRISASSDIGAARCKPVRGSVPLGSMAFTG